MHELIQLEVGQLSSNCYILFDDSSGKAVIIDPGDEADFIHSIVVDNDLKPEMIIATHGHFDHIMAVNELKLAYKIPFVIHKEDQFLLDRMRSSSIYFTDIDPGPNPEPDKYINNKIELSEAVFKVIETPGHTPGSVSLWSEDKKMIFVGDLIFSGGGVGRTDFEYGDRDILDDSIEKLMQLDDDVVVYPGHGESFLIGDFRKRYS